MITSEITSVGNIAALHVLAVWLHRIDNRPRHARPDITNTCDDLSAHFARLAKKLAAQHGLTLVAEPRPVPGEFEQQLNRVINGMIRLGWAEERLAASPYAKDKRLAERLAGIGE